MGSWDRSFALAALVLALLPGGAKAQSETSPPETSPPQPETTQPETTQPETETETATRVELSWSAPPGCPTDADVRAEVERLLGPTARREEPARVRGAMVRAGRRLWLELETSTREGEARRVLEGGSCEALAQAGALVIALAIDPEAVASSQAARARAAPVAPEPVAADAGDAGDAGVEPAPSVEPVRVTAPRDREPEPGGDVQLLVAASALFSAGPLPSPSPGAMLAIGARVGPVELTLAGAFFAEQSARLVDEPAAGGAFGLAYGRVRGCVPFLDETVSVAACLAFEGGAMWGRGEGVPRVQSGVAPWVAVALGLEGRWWFTDVLGLAVFGDLQVPLVRPPFELSLDGRGTVVHSAFEVGGLFGAGLVLRAP